MRRLEFLHCAGIDLARFKLLRQRGQLPFVIDAAAADFGGTGFTLDHAFRMRLMLDLLGREGDENYRLEGLGPNYAASVVSNAMYKFPRHPLNQIEPQDWFLGVAVFEEPQVGGETLRYSVWVACEIAHLSEWLTHQSEPDDTNVGRTVVRLFLANATRASEFVKAKAAAIKLPSEVIHAEVPGFEV